MGVVFMEEEKAPLTYASMRNDQKKVKKLIDRGADVNENTYGGMTPLLAAAERGNLQIAKMLINAGADVSFKGHECLFYAISNQNEPMVDLLIKSGADVNGIYNIPGDSFLSGACYQGNLNIIALLIKAGAEVNHVNPDGETVIMSTLSMRIAGTADIVKILIDAGVDVNALDSDGNSVLKYAKDNQGANAWNKKLKLEAQKVVDMLIRAGATDYGHR